MGQVALVVAENSAADHETVFSVLTDWERHGEWMPFTRARGGHEIGASVEGWTGIGPVGFLDTMIITDWRAGRRVGVRHTGRVVRGEAFFETRPMAGGGCRIVWGERLDLPLGPLGRIGWLAVGPVSRMLMRAGLRRLAGLAAREGP